MKIVGEATRALPNLARDLKVGGFGHGSRGLARDVYLSFTATVVASRGTEAESMAWALGRALALDLNRIGAREESLTVLKGLIDFVGIAHADKTMLAKLRRDEETIRRELGRQPPRPPEHGAKRPSDKNFSWQTTVFGTRRPRGEPERPAVDLSHSQGESEIAGRPMPRSQARPTEHARREPSFEATPSAHGISQGQASNPKQGASRDQIGEERATPQGAPVSTDRPEAGEASSPRPAEPAPVLDKIAADMFEAARATEVSAIGPESTAQTPYERRESREIDGAGSSKSDPEFGALARAAGPGDAKRREAGDEPSFEGVRASAAEPATDEPKVLNEAAHSKERAGSDLAAGSSGQIAESAIDEPSADTSGNEADIDELVQDEGDPVRAENWASAAGGGGLRGDLGRLTVDREQPLPPLIGEFRAPRRGSRRGTAFFLGVTTTVLAALAYGYATQNWKLVSSYVPGIATAFAPPTTAPAKPQPEPPALKTAHNSVEKLPAPGEGRVLSMEEVRYCIFQGRRLSELRNQMTGLGGNDLVNRYNDLVTDFNSRCRSFRYEKGVMEAIQREAAEKEVQLKADASAILAAWHPGSAQPQPVKATEPQVRDEPLIDLAATWGAARVQMRLMDLGFYRGTIDGVWGPKSKRALKNFKENNGLGVDDNWDIGTQSALLGKES